MPELPEIVFFFFFLVCHLVSQFTNKLSTFGRQPSFFLHSHLIFISLFPAAFISHNQLLSIKGKVQNHICWMTIMLMLVHLDSQKHKLQVLKYNQSFFWNTADQALFCLLNESCQISHRDSDGLDQSVTWHTYAHPGEGEEGRRETRCFAGFLVVFKLPEKHNAQIKLVRNTFYIF